MSLSPGARDSMLSNPGRAATIPIKKEEPEAQKDGRILKLKIKELVRGRGGL